MSAIAKHYRILGRVQGVFYRGSARAEALALGLVALSLIIAEPDSVPLAGKPVLGGDRHARRRGYALGLAPSPSGAPSRVRDRRAQGIGRTHRRAGKRDVGQDFVFDTLSGFQGGAGILSQQAVNRPGRGRVVRPRTHPTSVSRGVCRARLGNNGLIYSPSSPPT